MKKLSLSLITLLSLSSALAGNLSLSDLVGKYEISHPLLPVVNIVTISEDGAVTLVERSHQGAFKCEGEASLEDNTLESEVTCDNGAVFTQTIDLNGVSNLDQFSAPVYSSLYEMEFTMNFKRLED